MGRSPDAGWLPSVDDRTRSRRPNPVAGAARQRDVSAMIANTFARFVAERRALSAAVATALVAAGLTAAFATPAPRSMRRADGPTATAIAMVKAPPAPRSGQPRCFGAASRDPDQPCRNPRLRLMVVPTPRRARTLE